MGSIWLQVKENIDEEYLPSEIELVKYRIYLNLAVLSTIATPLLYSIIYVNRNKMNAVIQLYKEAVEILRPMTIFLVKPILTCLIVCHVISLGIYAFLWIENSGFETTLRHGFYTYEKDSWILLTRWLNIFACLWMICFIIDCQKVIVSATISFWYFCRINFDKLKFKGKPNNTSFRDKEGLGTPIHYGISNLIRYHLGSVSLGPLSGIILQMLSTTLAKKK